MLFKNIFALYGLASAVQAFESMSSTYGEHKFLLERDASSAVILSDSTGAVSMYAADDGNMYITEGNSTDSKLTIMNNAILGDVNSRVLHFYPDSLSQFGVSRVRLAPWGSIPKTAGMLTFTPFAIDANTTMIIGMDSLGNASFPVACNLVNQKKVKIFLVQDSAGDLDFLTDTNLQTTIMGDVVDSCAAIAVSAKGLVGNKKSSS